MGAGAAGAVGAVFRDTALLSERRARNFFDVFILTLISYFSLVELEARAPVP